MSGEGMMFVEIDEKRYRVLLGMYKEWLREHPSERIIRSDGFYHYAVERGFLIEEIESCEFTLALDGE